MARFTSGVNVGENVYKTFKTAAATTDADIGKPVKVSAADTVALCSDGDQIYGFIASVEPATADGKKIVSVLTDGRAWVILSGASAVGTIVEAAANEAVGVAKAGTWGLVSVHAIDDTDAGTLAASLPAKRWLVISGTGADGATVLIEKQ